MLLPGALEASRRTGIDPRIIIAQAAQETGWGRSAPGNNYFGVKSHGKPGGQTFTTHEVINGKRVKMQDSFRQFGSPSESALGYADFINSNPRYRNFKGAQGLEAQAAALGRSGYATDPNYGSTVYNIARGIDINGMGGNDTMMGGAMSPPPAPPAQEIGGDSLVPRSYPGMTPANTFGTMAPQPSDNLASSATNGAMGGMSPEEAKAIGNMIGDKKKSAWDHFTAAGEAFDQVMPAPRISGGGGDARATGNALTDFLNNMGGLEEGLIKRRLGFLGL